MFVNPASNDDPATGPTTQAVADCIAAGGHLSYAYLGRGLTTKTVTADTVVAYESPSYYDDGGINVLFGDGHVEFFTASQAAPMLAQVAAGVRPVKLKTP